MKAEDSLMIHFDNVGLPPAAKAWLLDLWRVIQALDDIVDRDEVKDPEALPWPVLVGMPGNPFFLENAQALLPCVANMYLKWRAANAVEVSGMADERSFMWRAAYYEVVLQCVLIVRGPESAAALAPDVLGMYGEKFEEYRKEFGNA